MKRTRHSHHGWSLLVMLVLFTIVVLIGAGRGSMLGTTTPSIRTSPVPAGSGSASSRAASVPSQPDPDGYEYLVTEERYIIRQASGELEVQQRRRESWRAADGWAWARQTGYDPGRFIFSPETTGEPIRRARPNATELEQAMRKELATTVPPSKLDDAEFNFVADLLGVETLPAGSLPKNYRRALIDVLVRNDNVAVTRQVSDPLGRDSTRISFANSEDRPGATQSIYLGRDYQYLAYITMVKGSDEGGSRIVTERRQVSHIPQDLLVSVGSQRVEKAIWD